MIVLDTNVISEIFRPQPNESVIAWLESLEGDVAITAITLAELLAGVRRLPSGVRKTSLMANIESALVPYHDGHSILPFDDIAAQRYADILIAREVVGAPITTGDAQIAAICLTNNATCATRNIKDFEHTGVELVDPWNLA